MSIHKSEGQTMKFKCLVELGKKEMDHGLTYAALSRAKKIRLVDGITEDRLYSKIKSQAKIKPRLEDKRLLGSFRLTKRKYFVD